MEYTLLSERWYLVPWWPKYWPVVMKSVIKIAGLVVVLMVKETLELMIYLIHSLGWFASWCCLQMSYQPLVFLHCIVCNILGKRQSLSIPHKFPFLEYYSFVARRGFSIGIQGIHELLSQISVPAGKFISVLTIYTSITSSSVITATTTVLPITYTLVPSAATAVTSAMASGIDMWNTR